MRCERRSHRLRHRHLQLRHFIGEPRPLRNAARWGCEFLGVVLRAVDEARLASPQEFRPIRYMPGMTTTPPSWRTSPLRVEHVDVEPRVVGPEAGGPEDGVDLVEVDQVDVGARPTVARRFGTGSLVASVTRALWSIVFSRRLSLRSASLQSLRSEPENDAWPPRARSSDEPTPCAVSALRSRSVVRRADQLRRRDVAGADEVVDLVVALVEPAGVVEPPMMSRPR